MRQADVASFLLGRGLVEPRTIVESDLSIIDASRRNVNFKVLSQDGPSYLLKQGSEAGGWSTVANEAAVYQVLTEHGNGIGRFIPRFYAYEREQDLLVLELVGDARDLHDHHARRGRFPRGVAGALGTALGTLHRITRLSEPQASSGAHPPWFLSIHRPDLSVMRESSAANLEVIKIVQQAVGFGDQLDRLARDWRTECLIHNDVKWDNCIVSTGADGRARGLKLVDWELARNGDPGWDLGSVFSHYLSFWAFSIPVTGDSPPERWPELARYPLSRMRPALRACWDAYRREAGLEGEDARRALVRAVRFAGGRLVQTAFEATQASLQLTGSVVIVLQLSLNVLSRPQQAAVQLLGLPLLEEEAT